MVTPEIPERGTLATAPLCHLVGQVARRRLTGLLELAEGTIKHRIFFMKGVPQGSRTGRSFNQLGAILVQLGFIDATVLATALEARARSEKLIGQVLLDMKTIDQAQLDRAMKEQSRLNMMALFALEPTTKFELHEGMVHLADFTAGPMPALSAVYEGLRDFAPGALLESFTARLPFAAVRMVEPGPTLARDLGPAEQMVGRLLATFRTTGDLARRIPLPAKALGALLAAMHELGVLEIGPALRAAQ
jgi:hypothetical protein